MHNVHIGIATDTWYPDLSRQDQLTRSGLALQMLTAAKECGYVLAVVDGGSDPAFLTQLTDAGIPYVLQAERGMSAGRQQGYRMLHEQGVTVFVRLEAEKVSMVTGGCITLAAQPIVIGQADIVVPARTAEGFASLPKYQAGSERAANAAFNAVLRANGLWESAQDLDVFFGPRLFSREAYELFMCRYAFFAPSREQEQCINPGKYSNALFYPVVNALFQGKHVANVAVPYVHPPEQTALEEGDDAFDRKRTDQTRSIITELVLLLNHHSGTYHRLKCIP